MDILYRIPHALFLQSNNSLCLLVSEENIFYSNSVNREKDLPMVAMLFSPIAMKGGNLIEDFSLMLPVKCFFI
jgi:hypothetical protein